MGKRSVSRRRSSVYGRSNNSIYIDGNTVRRIQPRFDERERRRERAERESGDTLSAPQVSFGYYAFFFLALALCAFVCLGYVRIHSEITASQKRVASLEGTLSQLQTSNDEEYERIMGSVDMEEIKRIAMTDLHMKYPDESQVVNVSLAGDDYVRQYGAIPGKQ
ncbi:MAG: cell division protein FtsL [Lachnospiraceae bacterium]|nr:cell division protein FtsL [Lachnospiraceae bacterium]